MITEKLNLNQRVGFRHDWELTPALIKSYAPKLVANGNTNELLVGERIGWCSELTTDRQSRREGPAWISDHER